MEAKSHFINNAWLPGNGIQISAINPTTGKINWQGRCASPSEINDAVIAAKKAFAEWSNRPLSYRIGFMQAFRDRLSRQAQRVSELISMETGKPKWESQSEVQSMISKIAISIEAYQDRNRVIQETIPGTTTVTRFRPHGVIAVFGPFNLPGHLPNGHIVPAIIAGNTVVFKPSSQTPMVAEAVIQLWESTGIPDGVINLIQGNSETGKTLSKHPGLNGLFLTGSESTGKSVHKLFSDAPEKILALEMGGNNPLVAHDVSDLEAAAYLTILSAFITAGQRCSCARRLIVVEDKNGTDFIERLIEIIGKIQVGPYTNSPEPFMGPVISKNAASRLLDAQQNLVNKGGRILCAMKPLGETSNMLSPGLIDVTRVQDRVDEEMFGPILQLIWVPDFKAAITEANNTRFGLAAGLLSDNPDLYHYFLLHVRAGVINWNRQTTGASARMPFGGVGASGNHRPGAYFTTDHCSYPVASIEVQRLFVPNDIYPGIAF
jgi:succinylglutamic semialdehyde dehydrogenase